jgi:hypothetical protein
MFTLAFYQLVAPLRSLYRCALSGAAGDLAFWAARSALIGDCGERSTPTRSQGARDLGCGFEVGVLLDPFGAAVRRSEFSRGLVAAAGWVRGVCGRPSGDAHPLVRAVSPI